MILCSFCDKSCYKNRLFVRVFETVDTSVSLRGMTSDRESSPLEHPWLDIRETDQLESILGI